MNKRTLIIVGGGILGIVFIGLIAFGAGCFRTKEYKAPKSNEIVELTYYKLFDDSEVMEPVIQEYRALFPNVKINYRQFTDSQEYYDLILNELAEGEGPDIFSVPNTWFIKNYKKVYPAPTNMYPSQIFEDTFVSVTMDDLVKQNPDTAEVQVYGMPMMVDTLALYYNKDHFDDAIPEQGKPSVTWAGIKEDVFRLTKKDNSFERFEVSGMAMGFADNVSRAADILYLLMIQDGGDIYDKNYMNAIFAQQQGIDSDGSTIKPGINALELYTSFADPSNKNYSWNSYLSDANSAEKEITAFARGKVSMIIGYSYMYDQILAEVGELQTRGLSTIDPDVIRISMIPQKIDPAQSTEKRVAYAHYFAETVARTSDNPTWAWDFLVFATSKESLQHYNDKTHKPTSRRDMIEEQKVDPIYGVFAEQIGIAESFPIYDDMAYEDIFLKAIESVLSTKGPADAMKIAQDEINAMLPSEGLIPQVTAPDEEETAFFFNKVASKAFKKARKGIKNLTFLKVSAFLFYAFVFLIPFQVDVVVYTSAIFEGGNFNPYTSIFYYLADVVFLLALVTWGIALLKGEAKHKLTYGKWVVFVLLMLFVVAGEVSVLFASDQWLSLMLVLRFAEFLLIYLYMVNDAVKLDVIINVFIASVSFQAAIALMQYIYQGPVGLHMLGEPLINSVTPGIAKMDLDGSKIIRAYGTFQHSNILAGYLVTGIFLTFYRIRQKEHLAYPILILLLAALILTFSRSAILALVVASLVFVSIKDMKVSLKYVFLALSLLILFVVIFNLEQTILNKLLFTDGASFDDRVFYFSIGKNMMYTNPLGVGLGNFTLMMPDFTHMKLAPWDFQPVHNIYMLLVNEIGFAGFIIFSLLLVAFAVYLFIHQNKSKTKKANAGVYLLACLVAIAVIGLFDHYPVSLYQGQLLLFIVFGLSGKYLMTKTH